MATICVHGLEPAIEQSLRDRARRLNRSLNSVVKEVLTDSLSPSHSARRREQQRGMFVDLFGTWSKEQAVEFDDATAAFRRVDPGDWE